MKNILIYLSLFISFILITGCEDVVNVDLKDDQPKLVIDAAIKWQKGTTGENQIIKLSLTNNFYTNEIVPASGATVTVTNSSNTVFDFIESGTTGNYLCTNFVPVVNESYTLTVQYNGAIYTSTSKLYATPPIINVQQETVTGIDGSDLIQIKFFYQDNGAEENYYLITVVNPNKVIPEYGALSDEFFQGNVMFGFYASDKTNPGITLLLQVQGISKSYYNYMNKLITIASTNSGNPFATPPVTLRGNIINQTNQNDFPLGYFSLGETDTRNYLVQ
ncbi:DUF4249 domain-containing protein [Flavobacterium sp. SM15]|uniref:DUF4249 domain-containing protein n=1 Tax=Flavobacterium sp. SM15 TaxID=2908005 RepID=UPI001EDC5B0F|nr:DUF4249 domain-containing protein [Flavobacterium sp. SM15]MCG2611749.1 DUF4249 domain-containing protein [Flavobacterium sp. SM15]